MLPIAIVSLLSKVQLAAVPAGVETEVESLGKMQNRFVAETA